MNVEKAKFMLVANKKKLNPVKSFELFINETKSSSVERLIYHGKYCDPIVSWKEYMAITASKLKTS